MAYLDDLATSLFSMVPGERRRLWFNPKVRPYLAVEEADDGGLQRFGQIMRQVKGAPGYDQSVFAGLFMDRRKRLVLVTSGGGLELLAQLHAFVAARIQKMPALVVFCDAGVADATAPVKDSAALRVLEVEALEVVRDDALWDALRTQSLDQLEAVVAGFAPGDAGWYHLAPRDDGGAPLLLVPAAFDPLQIHFNRMVRALGDAELESRGTVLMDDDGRFQFLATDLEPPLLLALGQFVRDHQGTHPRLARLRDASLAAVAEDFSVRQELAVDLAWDGIAELPAPDSVAASAAVLAAMKTGDKAWFWCPDHPVAVPFFALYRMTSDLDGQVFAHARERLALRYRRGTDVTPGVIGIAEVVSDQTIALTVPAPLAQAAARAVAATVHDDAWELPALERMSGAVVTGMVGQEIKAVLLVEQFLRLQDSAEKLVELGPDDALYFWYLSAGVDGRPVVCLDDDRDRLRAAATRWATHAPRGAVTARGRIRRSKGGDVVFLTKEPVKGLLPDIQRWARANRALVDASALAAATHRVVG